MANDLLFHETFQPEIVYISKILELAVEEESGDKFGISKLTGIPTGDKKGKVEPHIKYAQYMGLINYICNRGVYSLSATALGKEIWKQDKYLHETLTLWLLHYCISRENVGAPQWWFFIRKVNCGFNITLSSNYVNSQIKKEFNILEGDIAKNFGVVKNSYLSGCFSNLYYLNWGDELVYEEKTEQIEFCYLYAYALLDSWSDIFPEKKELILPTIIEDLSFGKIFGLNDEEIDSVLCTLQDKGIISINRQLFPITVVRTSEVGNVIESLYSMLM